MPGLISAWTLPGHAGHGQVVFFPRHCHFGRQKKFGVTVRLPVCGGAFKRYQSPFFEAVYKARVADQTGYNISDIPAFNGYHTLGNAQVSRNCYFLRRDPGRKIPLIKTAACSLSRNHHDGSKHQQDKNRYSFHNETSKSAK
jgi:hypothetical protein